MSNSATINGSVPPIRINQLTEEDGYMIAARDFLQGVEALSVMPKLPPRNCSLIAAQALECILKAFLWHKGRRKEIRRPENQHNLVALWNMAYKEGDLGITQVPPDWVTILSIGHGPNFYFRYQEGEGKTIVHCGQTPALLPMKTEIKELFRIVELAIKG